MKKPLSTPRCNYTEQYTSANYIPLYIAGHIRSKDMWLTGLVSPKQMCHLKEYLGMLFWIPLTIVSMFFFFFFFFWGLFLVCCDHRTAFILLDRPSSLFGCVACHQNSFLYSLHCLSICHLKQLSLFLSSPFPFFFFFFFDAFISFHLCCRQNP